MMDGLPATKPSGPFTLSTAWKERRLGEMVIPPDIFDHMNDLALQALWRVFMPFRIEQAWSREGILFAGASPLFLVVPPQQQIPVYVAILTESRDEYGELLDYQVRFEN